MRGVGCCLSGLSGAIASVATDTEDIAGEGCGERVSGAIHDFKISLEGAGSDTDCRDPV